MEKAQKFNVMFVETSAKTKEGIHNLFDNLIEVLTSDEEAQEQQGGGHAQAGAGHNEGRSGVMAAGAGGTALNKQVVEEKPAQTKKKCCGK